ncbi:helix-turn-helix domain-containing protein [uncultured Draconibacterium sp.]|uniref:helix-turn-helix domain-containing protein n=1 Tax=uncultured Draconibacterium sp. TaxID=1573823 RepID=UPI0029C63748|nr:helix-turn-helix domain-containing protein [uncultured Draconibacterium sp.]
MPELFINKAKQFILNNLENDKFGVSELASEMGLSRSQFLRKIKSVTGKSANKFIRDIRLEESISLIENDDHTVSEIAYKVGFSSPSYFNKCFHDKYGCTPGDYKKRAETGESEEQENRQIPISRNRLRVAGLFLLFIIVTAVFGYWGSRSAKTSGAENQYASIAVLPLLDLSENKDKEYLSMGLTDAITLELSRFKELRVISRGSAMLFRDSVKLYSEIAEKLGVDLLLEGSIIYGADSLRVIVQLIEPFPQERHLWANKYDSHATDIRGVSSDISSRIAEEINLAVMPESDTREIKDADPKAQELYLRGDQLWQQQNPEAVSMAINYLKESIANNPDFAPAYCSLAEAYMAKNKMFPGNNEEKLQNRLESQKAINTALDKAIELDGSLAEAYITKGMIMRKVDWDWEGMKEMAEKGLKLNPNNKDGYMILSDYYLIKGNHKKSVQQALIAEQYDPLNARIGCLVAERYMYAGEYEKSVEQFKKVLELYPRYSFAWDGIGFAYFMSGDNEMAKNSWKELHMIMGNTDMAEFFEVNDFNHSVDFILTKFTAGDKLYCSNPPIIAMAHLLVDRKQGALDYLDIAYEYRNEDLPVLMLHPVFGRVKNDERYITLADELGVTIPD